MKKKLPSAGVHEMKDTNKVDVFIPPHRLRVTTELFRRTKQKLIAVSSFLRMKIYREKGRCYICGRTAEEAGQPLEAHHFGIERSFIDSPLRWDVIRKDFPDFDWATFDQTHPEAFVDDMLAQGILLCKLHHTGEGTGIHSLPFPLWIMQRYLPDGVRFTPTEIIHHDEV